MSKSILILPGDGIGQEVTASMVEVLNFLIGKTIDQPTWVPGGDSSHGYVREGQNSVVREIKMRMERAKNG